MQYGYDFEVNLLQSVFVLPIAPAVYHFIFDGIPTKWRQTGSKQQQQQQQQQQQLPRVPVDVMHIEILYNAGLYKHIQ